jgi:hypothetical protein
MHQMYEMDFQLSKRDKCWCCMEYIRYEAKVGVCRIALITKGHKWPGHLDDEGYVIRCPKFTNAKQLKMEVTIG